MKKQVVIVGGGYGGLATANLFAKVGYAVTIVEKNAQLGGRAGQLVQDGFRFDTGPSWYLMPEVFESYYKLFGKDVAKELSLTRLTPGYKVFFESDNPVTIRGNLREDSQTFDGLENGAGTSLQAYVDASTRLYELSLKHFLYSNFTRKSQLLHRDILKELPRLSTIATASLDTHVSKYFTDPRIRRILEYHSVFLGGSPYEIPALYSLMSTLDFKSGVFFPKNGIYSLVESLVSLGESLGVQYRTNSPVQKIIVNDGVATGVALENGDIIEADIVISDADLHYTETKLIEPKYQTYPEKYWKRKQSGPSALLVSLGFEGSLTNLEHHNLYFVDAWKENFDAIYTQKDIPEHASVYICNPSKTDPTAAPKNTENIFILVPLPSGKKLTTEQTSALVARSVQLLEKITDTRNLTDRIISQDIVTPSTFETRFNAWEYNALGGQSHLLFQSAFFRTPNMSKKVKNLYYVGAGTTPGIGLPMCLISAELVYKRVAKIQQNGPLTTILKEGQL
jgi:phytoene desaturase